MFEYWVHVEKKDNRNIVGSSKNVFWLIDGFPDIFNINYISKQSDIFWVLEELNKRIPKCIKPELSLEEIIDATLGEIYFELDNNRIKLHNIPKYMLPSFSITMFRINDNDIEYYCLGNCSLLVNIDGKLSFLSDNRINPILKEERKMIEKLNNNLEDFKERELKIYQTTRKKQNTSDGYWIGTLDAIGIPHGVKGKIEFIRDFDILCYSNGFYPTFYHKYLRYSASLFNKSILEKGLEKLKSKQGIKDNISIILIKS